ncbi:MAG TPA: NAD-dependent epimerase/dehydratase family protein [Acidimicrobiia bacterium]|nr:NAD-dependent epimerase/dehydratase family protein [Acidimicrobiia bacterium]
MERSIAGTRVLVTGAGLVGSRLVERLVGEDVKEVRVLDRSARQLERLGADVDGRVGDITDAETVVAAADGVDYVFHTAAVLEGNDVEAYHRVNEWGTEVVAQAAASAGARRLVHLSSVAVYGFATGDISEDHPMRPTAQAYSMSKAAGEAAAFTVGQAKDLEVTAIRPAGVFGPGSRYFTGTFMKRASRRPIRMVGSGRGVQPVVFIDDVVDLLVAVATHPAAQGEVFHCAIDPPPTQREYVQAYGRLIGNESFLGIPTGLVAALGSVIVPFSKKGTYARQLPRNVRQIDKRVRYRMDKAEARLGWRPRFDVAAGVAASVPWLVENGFVDEGELV